MIPGPVDIRDGCLATLRYFGIFRYPLTVQEVHRFNSYRSTLQETAEALEELESEGLVFHTGFYYLTENDPGWVTERESGNVRAFALLDKTGRYASLIASCPFVRGVAISGSLSKFYASVHPDIDYFIITEAGRLWIARTLLHLFKKLTFLTGHQHFFCMNYFVDTRRLTITHQNRYSAIEVATLLPAYNLAMILEFYEMNSWIETYLPNHPGIVNRDYLVRERKRPCKHFFESLLNILFPSATNRALMKITDRKWRRKWKRQGYPEADYERAFLTELHVSKNHPEDYEKKVLSMLTHARMNNTTQR